MHVFSSMSVDIVVVMTLIMIMINESIITDSIGIFENGVLTSKGVVADEIQVINLNAKNNISAVESFCHHVSISACTIEECLTKLTGFTSALASSSNVTTVTLPSVAAAMSDVEPF